jgi:hypothetical protein
VSRWIRCRRIGRVNETSSKTSHDRVIRVLANWDAEAKVWVAESDDVAGLITEAPTVEAPIEKVRVLIPDLIAENEEPDSLEVPYELLWRTHQVARLQR